jgi:hypothetical protein
VIRRGPVVAAFVALALLGLALRDDPRKLGSTSFGYVPSGHRAVFELFVGLGWPVARSYGPADLLLPQSSGWWIEPGGLCDSPPDEGDAGARVPGQGDSLVAFAERGGTAVVALSAQPTFFGSAVGPCLSLGGVTLPPRDLPILPLEEIDPEEEAVPRPTEGEVVAQWVESDLGGGTRILELPQLVAFVSEPEAPWRVRARVDGRALIVERGLGQGRLVVVADASFLRNAWLDAGDAAPLAASPAAPLFVGLALLGSLVFWWGTARPAPLPGVTSTAAPTLEGFVASLAALYGKSRDYTQVAERYRALSVARLRRHYGLPSDAGLGSVLARLRRQGRLEEAELSALERPAHAASAGELARQIRRFDAIVEEGSR